MQIFQKDILPDPGGVFLVGGCVRDMLLGRTPVDYDLVVEHGHAEAFAEDLAARLNTRAVPLGKDHLRIHRILTGNNCFDVSPLFGGHIHKDLLNRDFTLNAIGFNLETHKYLDVTGGLDDLRNKIVRKVTDDIFIKDPVRLMRAFRISAGYGFEIEPETLALIQRDRHLIQNSPGERIRSEWLKLLSFSNSFPCLKAMEKIGLLFEIFPEIGPLKGCGQNQHHAFDVLEHTLAAFEALEKLIHTHPFPLSDILTGQFSGFGRDILSCHFTPERKALLKHAMLLHDLAKPLTKTLHEDGSIHFFKHAAKGADLTLDISRRLRFSNREKDFVHDVIRHHNQVLNLFLLNRKGDLKTKIITRFFMACRDFIPDLLLHSLGDHRGKGTDQPNGFEDFVLQLFRTFSEDFHRKQNAGPLLNGKDLKESFHLNPSPIFKTLLNRVEEARLSGEIHSKDQALALVKRCLMETPSISG